MNAVVASLLVITFLCWLFCASAFVTLMLAERRQNKNLAESFSRAEKEVR